MRYPVILVAVSQGEARRPAGYQATGCVHVIFRTNSRRVVSTEP
jgi:hypothetical protein